MDLLEELSVIDVADSVGLLCFGFGARNLLLGETFGYYSVQTPNVSVCFYSAAAAARDVAAGMVVTSLVEIVPLLGLEYATNLIQAH